MEGTRRREMEMCLADGRSGNATLSGGPSFGMGEKDCGVSECGDGGRGGGAISTLSRAPQRAREREVDDGYENRKRPSRDRRCRER